MDVVESVLLLLDGLHDLELAVGRLSTVAQVLGALAIVAAGERTVLSQWHESALRVDVLWELADVQQHLVVAAAAPVDLGEDQREAVVHRLVDARVGRAGAGHQHLLDVGSSDGDARNAAAKAGADEAVGDAGRGRDRAQHDAELCQEGGKHAQLYLADGQDATVAQFGELSFQV